MGCIVEGVEIFKCVKKTVAMEVGVSSVLINQDIGCANEDLWSCVYNKLFFPILERCDRVVMIPVIGGAGLESIDSELHDCSEIPEWLKVVRENIVADGKISVLSRDVWGKEELTSFWKRPSFLLTKYGAIGKKTFRPFIPVIEIGVENMPYDSLMSVFQDVIQTNSTWSGGYSVAKSVIEKLQLKRRSSLFIPVNGCVCYSFCGYSAAVGAFVEKLMTQREWEKYYMSFDVDHRRQYQCDANETVDQCCRRIVGDFLA